MSFAFEKRYLSFFAFLLCAALVFCRLQSSFPTAALQAGKEETFTVIIDAGHGGMDAGAIGINGALEKNLNLAYAETLAALFREAGVNVLMTRNEDSLVLKEGEENSPSRKACDLKNRVEIGSGIENALFLSVHMNSFPESKYKGFECYYSLNNEESRVYAEAIQCAVKEKHEPNSRRCAKGSEDIYLLAHLNIPAVLIECGFISNKEDAAKLSSKDYQKELCFSVFYAIMEMKEKTSKG